MSKESLLPQFWSSQQTGNYVHEYKITVKLESLTNQANAWVIGL